MVSWLQTFYRQENEIVYLFYAITNCQGWIKSTEKEVIVRLEPNGTTQSIYGSRGALPKIYFF